MSGADEKALTGDLPAPPDTYNALAEIEKGRAVQEALASLAIAQKMPRSEVDCEVRILRECARYELAEAAVYRYPKAGAAVTGASIRLAEVLARYWKNTDYGFRQLESTKERSTVEAFCFDKESNTRVVRTFYVEHKVALKGGATKALLDPRDIYEHVASQAQRRVRACILSIIPGYVVDKALERCRETIKAGDGKEPLQNRVVRMAEAFQVKFGVTTAQMEKKLGKALALMTGDEFVEFWAMYKSLEGGNAKPGDFFEVAAADRETSLTELFDD